MPDTIEYDAAGWTPCNKIIDGVVGGSNSYRTKMDNHKATCQKRQCRKARAGK